MPFQLDDYDVAVLKSLVKDGRKSFREISRETGITTPTVKARFQRLVNIGFIKSISPIFDYGRTLEEKIQTKNKNKNIEQHDLAQIKHQPGKAKSRIKKGLKIKLDCDFCKWPIAGYPQVFKFANYERFFCCSGCVSGYKENYAGRIDSIKRKFEGIE